MFRSNRRILELQQVTLVTLTLMMAPLSLSQAQDRGTPYGEWRYQSADSWGTRYSPVNQIDSSNFGDLEVAWTWQANNFGPEVDYQMKSTPTYIDGILYTVAGQRRTVVAIDPNTGEKMWQPADGGGAISVEQWTEAVAAQESGEAEGPGQWSWSGGNRKPP